MENLNQLKKFKFSKLILYVLLVVGALIIAGLVWLYFGPKMKLESELKRIALPYKTVSQRYSFGICLDNCPGLITAYNISPTPWNVEVETVSQYLKAKGYIFDENDTGSYSDSGGHTFHVLITSPEKVASYQPGSDGFSEATEINQVIVSIGE